MDISRGASEAPPPENRTPQTNIPSPGRGAGNNHYARVGQKNPQFHRPCRGWNDVYGETLAPGVPLADSLTPG